MNVADLNLPAAAIKQLENVYRLVGLRDYGIAFDAAAVPVIAMTQLVGDFLEYLKDVGASKPEQEAHTALFSQLCEVS